MAESSILIVDDNADVRMSLTFLLNNHGYKTIEADSLSKASKCLTEHVIQLVLLDMNFQFDTTSGREGIEFLRQLPPSSPPVIAMTAWSSVELAVAAMQQGACDFFAKPWDNQQVLTLVKLHIALNNLEKPSNSQATQSNNASDPSQQKNGTNLLWHSTSMQTLKAQLDKVAGTDVNVLLRGENGTGKTQLARYLHQQSGQGGEFISVNVTAIPESLFESELFGHKKGAFTDAKQDREGRFSAAKNGTLLLDEIGSLAAPLQAKLLRVLESNEYEIIGDSTTHQTQCRIISATNSELESMVENGEFRRDLYFRLNTIELTIPPLRQRTEDILPLAEHFLSIHCQHYQLDPMSLSEDAKEALLNYHWPGNIRELSHMMTRAALLSDNPTIPLQQLSFAKLADSDGDKQNLSSANMPLMTLEDAEKKLLVMALKQSQQRVEDAADLLGISKSAIYRRLEKYKISTK